MQRIAMPLHTARRTLAAVVAIASLGVAALGPARAQAVPSLVGVPATQPNLPVKLQRCTAELAGQTFTPRLVFDSAAKATVVSSTVLYSFFDAANLGLADVSFSSVGTLPLPTRATTFTCSVTREVLSDGTAFPVAQASSGGGPTGTALVVAGVVGVSLIAALSSRGGSGATVNAGGSNPSGSPSSGPSAPGAGGGPGSTPTATATATATGTGSGATPTASPTASPTAGPTGAGGGPTPTGSPTATASSTITLNPTSLSFTSIEATMNATLSETNYAGTFAIAPGGNTCTSGGVTDNGAVAMVSPTSGIANGQANNITVKSSEAGRCSVTFVDTNSPQQSATLTIDVTGTNVVVNARSAKPQTPGQASGSVGPSLATPAPVPSRAPVPPAQPRAPQPHLR